MSEEQKPKKSGPQELELDLSSPSLEVEATVVGQLTTPPAVPTEAPPATPAAAAAEPPPLPSAESVAVTGAIEIPAEPEELIDEGPDLLAASLQAAVEATGQIMRPDPADDQLEQAVEIPLPAQGLKVTSATGEQKVIASSAPAASVPAASVPAASVPKASAPPTAALSSAVAAAKAAAAAGTRTGMTRASLVSPKGAAPAGASVPGKAAPEKAPSKVMGRLAPIFAKMGPLLEAWKKASARLPSLKPKKDIELPWHFYVGLGVLVLCCGVYGAFVALEYRAGPHAAWERVIKGWKKGDFELVSTVLAEDIEEVPLFIVNRYPRLVLTSESDFGALIKRVSRLRHESYEKEFKKGFASKFWEFQMKEMVSYGDRVDISYVRDAEELIFTMELRDEEWKLVDIDTSKAQALFQIDEEELKGATL